MSKKEPNFVFRFTDEPCTRMDEFVAQGKVVLTLAYFDAEQCGHKPKEDLTHMLSRFEERCRNDAELLKKYPD